MGWKALGIFSILLGGDDVESRRPVVVVVVVAFVLGSFVSVKPWRA